MVSGGGTQAEGSINLVQTGNYQGNLTFKLRHGGGSSDWMERLHITSGGKVGVPAVAESSALLGINAASTSELSDSSGLYNQGNPCYLQIKNTTDDISDPECGIILQPRNSANGSVAIYAKRTGSYTSDLIYRVRTGSSTSAERLRITSGGEITSGDLRINGFTHSNSPTGYAQFQSDNHANTFFGQNLKLGTNGSSGDNTVEIINQHSAIGGAGMYIGGNGNSAVNKIRFYVTDANQSAGTDVSGDYYWQLWSGGRTTTYSYGKYVQYYTTVQNASTYITHVAIPMNGNTAYEIRLQNSGNGISHIRCMASHWTSNYDSVSYTHLTLPTNREV